MTKPIDFIAYLSKYQIKDSLILTYLNEPISFSDIGIQVSLCFDQKGLVSIDFEPELYTVEYAEIDIEFHDITYFSFSIEDKETFIENISYYSKVLSLIVSSNSVNMVCLLENGKRVQLALTFNRIEFNYDISWMIEVSIIQKLYRIKKDKNILFEMLNLDMSDDMFDAISKADYGDGKEEAFQIFKASQKTSKIPPKVSFQTAEVLLFYNYTDAQTKEVCIAKSFSLVFALVGDYQMHVTEDSLEYWLIELSILSNEFSREYKEELLKFYIDYLFTKHTYSNPFSLLLFLIITMMTILDYPQQEIDLLYKELYRSDYIKRYDCYFFPKWTLSKFKSMIATLNDNNKEERLYSTLDEMIDEMI